VAGLLIVLAFLGSLDLATRTRAIKTPPLLENSAISREPQIPQEFVSETASLPRAQIAPVPLPLKKPAVIYKVPNGKGAKGIPGAKKRMAHQKAARQKLRRI
jgi:hypothetical protein